MDRRLPVPLAAKTKIFFALAALIIAAVYVIAMETVVVGHLDRTYTTLPFWDTWDNYTPNQLVLNFFQHHNEHLIVIPRIIMLLDLMTVQGRGYLSLAFIHLSLAGLGAFVGLMAARNLNLLGWKTIALSLFFTGTMLSLLQHNVLEWTFMSQWPLVFLFAGLVYWVVLFWSHLSARLITALLFGVCATLSMANGMFVFLPVAVIGALYLRDWRIVTFALLATAILAAIGIPGMGVHHGMGTKQPVDIIRFTAVYLGAPVGEIITYMFPRRFAISTTRAAEAFGYLLIFSFAALTLLGLRNQNAYRTWLVTFGGFLLLTAIVSGAGRFTGDLSHATASRFSTPALLFTLVCLSLTLEFIARHSEIRPFAYVSAIALAILLFMHSRYVAAREHDGANARKLAAAAIVSKVRDEPVYGLAYPHSDAFPTLIAAGWAAKVAIFSYPWTQWLGKPLPLPINGVCLGNFEAVQAVPQGDTQSRRTKGWVWNSEKATVPRLIFFTDKNSTVVGFGFSGFRRDDVAGGIGSAARYSGWHGYLRDPLTPPFRAFALTDKDSVCSIPQGQAIYW